LQELSNVDRLLQLAHDLGMVRPRDLAGHGVPRVYLYRLCQRGLLHRLGRDLYALPDLLPTEHSALAEACKRIPRGLDCLLSALAFHDLSTQAPFEVWMAIHTKARSPHFEYPPLQIVRFSGPALTEGVEEHAVEEGTVRVYGVAKTEVDCFRYRNKIGLDVALEALRECRRDRRAMMDEIWRYAKMLRMANVIRPYLEANA
jgi:predicted transcriptional regulator of viral defense system